MKYQKSSMTTGAWLKSSDVKSGTKARLVSETTPQPSQFLDKEGKAKTQDVAKIRLEGQTEAFNVSINRASINALVDAFGDDSIKWQGNAITLETEKVRVAGKAVVALYIIPEGYEKRDDANGYAVIVKKDGMDESMTTYQQDNMSDEDIPIITEEDLNMMK